jgi:hypothetical protein
VDYLPAQDLTFIFLSNLQSAANWQLRAQVRNVLTGRAVEALAAVPAVAPSFEPSGDLVGAYGDPADPVMVTEVRGRLFRDENEFYPIAGGLYSIPASGATQRIGRDSGGRVDSVFVRFGSAPERALRRIR